MDIDWFWLPITLWREGIVGKADVIVSGSASLYLTWMLVTHRGVMR